MTLLNVCRIKGNAEDFTIHRFDAGHARTRVVLCGAVRRMLALTGATRMYRFETEIRPLPPADRHAQRQESVRPIVAAVLERVQDMHSTTLPSEPLRKELNYVRNQRDALQRFLEDGGLEADNNTAENAIRRLALGRKNWVFAGSERGGRAAALYLGLIQSCKACDVNPWAYLDDIFRRIMSHPVSRLRELLPDQWRPRPRDAHGLILQG